MVEMTTGQCGLFGVSQARLPARLSEFIVAQVNLEKINLAIYFTTNTAKKVALQAECAIG
jgi:hypothetical protein